jgi:hypothetical protein
MCDTLVTRMNLGDRRLLLNVKFQARPMTRCIVIVETEGPLLVNMWSQRETAATGTLFTALTNHDLLL